MDVEEYSDFKWVREIYQVCEIKKQKTKKQRDIPGGNWLGVRAKIVEWCGRSCKYWLDHRAITGV